MSQPERARNIQEEEALSAATELLHQPQRGFLMRNRGKIGLILGLGWGFAAGYMASRKGTLERPEQIQPQVQAKVVGVLLCNPDGCMALRPEEMAELGNGCEEPGFAEPPEFLDELPFCDELPELVIPTPQNFPGPRDSEPSAFDPTRVEL